MGWRDGGRVEGRGGGMRESRGYKWMYFKYSSQLINPMCVRINNLIHCF